MDVSAWITIRSPFNNSLTRSHRYAFKRHGVFDQRKIIHFNNRLTSCLEWDCNRMSCHNKVEQFFKIIGLLNVPTILVLSSEYCSQILTNLNMLTAP